MSLDEDLRRIRASQEAQLAPELRRDLDHAVEQLRRGETLARVPRAGDAAPEFDFVLPGGERIRSADLPTQGPLVLLFLRGTWCPYGAEELRHVEGFAPWVRELGATLIGVAPQTTEAAGRLAEALQLSFPLVGDPGSDLARRFGLVPELTDGLRAALAADKGPDAPEELDELPLPAAFVVDPIGVVRFSFAAADPRERAEPEEWLAVLRGL